MTAGVGRSATAPEAESQSPGAPPDTLPIGRRQRLLAVVAVTVVAILGTGLRAAQAAAYLPSDHHWDEITNVRVGEDMAADQNPDPGFYDYPALIFLAQALVLVPAEKFGNYDPGAKDVLEVQSKANARVNEPGLLLSMRWVAGVIPGVVTIVVAGLIAWMVTQRWWTSGLAALLVALSALDLRYGAFVTPDALSGMATTLAALAAVGVARAPTRGRYLLAGAAIGLAAAAKYNAAVAAVGLVIAHVITQETPVADRRRLFEAAGVATLVFGLINIGGVLHPYQLIAEIGSEGVHYGSEHPGSQGNSPIFNASWLWMSFGLALAVAAGGFYGRSQRVRQATYILGGLVGTYFVFVSAFPVRFARNLLPLTGTIAAAAAIGFFVVVERVASRLRARTSRVCVIGAATLVALIVPVIGAASATASISEDPWSETLEWVHDSLPEGSTVALEARAPFVDDARYDVISTVNLGEHDVAWYRARGVDVLIAVDVTYQHYFDDPDEDPEITANYHELLADHCVAFAAEGGAYETQDRGHRILVVNVPPRC